MRIKWVHFFYVAIVKMPLEQGAMKWGPKGGMDSGQFDDFSGFSRKAEENHEHPYCQTV